MPGRAVLISLSVTACARVSATPPAASPQETASEPMPTRLHVVVDRKTVTAGRVAYTLDGDIVVQTAYFRVHDDRGELVVDEQVSPMRRFERGEPITFCWEATRPPQRVEVRLEAPNGFFTEYVLSPYDVRIPDRPVEFAAGSYELDQHAETKLRELVAVIQEQARMLAATNREVANAVGVSLYVAARHDEGELGLERAQAIAEYLAPRVSFVTYFGAVAADSPDYQQIQLRLETSPLAGPLTRVDATTAPLASDPAQLPSWWIEHRDGNEAARQRRARQQGRECNDAVISPRPEDERAPTGIPGGVPG